MLSDPINLTDAPGTGPFESAKKIYDAAKNTNDRMKNLDKYIPPDGKKWTDINPETGNPYVVDEQKRSEKDFWDQVKDVHDAAEGAAELTAYLLKKGIKEATRKPPKDFCK